MTTINSSVMFRKTETELIRLEILSSVFTIHFHGARSRSSIREPCRLSYLLKRSIPGEELPIPLPGMLHVEYAEHKSRKVFI